MEEVINKLYDSLINVVLKDFTDPEMIENVKTNYRKILYKRCTPTLKTETNMMGAYDFLYDIEYNYWIDKSLSYKQHILVEDINYDKIARIRYIALESAKARKTTNKTISADEVTKLMDEANALKDKVYEFNKPLAENYISEIALSLSYAAGNDDIIISEVESLKK